MARAPVGTRDPRASGTFLIVASQTWTTGTFRRTSEQQPAFKTFCRRIPAAAGRPDGVGGRIRSSTSECTGSKELANSGHTHLRLRVARTYARAGVTTHSALLRVSSTVVAEIFPPFGIEHQKIGCSSELALIGMHTRTKSNSWAYECIPLLRPPL